jgi:hypothetical protein
MYRVDFELTSFDLIRRNHVQVRGGATAAADATLLVSAVCDCVNITSASAERERSGQVLDDSNRPLPHVQLQLAGAGITERACADAEGRFTVRLPVTDVWLLTVYSGSEAQSQRVSGDDAASIVFRLPRGSTTGLPDVQRFPRPCCPGRLAHLGR